ncbi:MAG: IS4 family transposase [Prosthecobacter sp.]
MSQRIGDKLRGHLREEPVRHQGPRQKMLLWQIIAALVVQCLHRSGSLEQIVWRYFAVRISSSALSQRRVKIPHEVFETCMRHALEPLACERRHPQSFFAGLRLVGIDAGQWNLINTAEINATVAKSKSRRGKAGFAKLSMSTLVELGTHAPLACAMSLGHLSEKALSHPLLAALPRKSLLIADRYYGQAPMLRQLQESTQNKESHFIVRVREKLSVRVQKANTDGSAEVSVTLRERVEAAEERQSLPGKQQIPTRGRPRKHAPMQQSELRVREINGTVRGSQGQRIKIRLWTSLSVREAKAREVLQIYAKRWEQEIFYKELKLGLHGSDLLNGQRTESAMQQVAALIIASSLVAEERLAIAACSQQEGIEQVAVTRISFSQCLEHTVALLIVLQAAQGLMSESAQGELVKRVRTTIAQAALPPRRRRSCQRKVRQPIKKWPRMLSPTSIQTNHELVILPFA